MEPAKWVYYFFAGYEVALYREGAYQIRRRRPGRRMKFTYVLQTGFDSMEQAEAAADAHVKWLAYGGDDATVQGQKTTDD